MFWRLRRLYYKGIIIRLGFGDYFFQFTIGAWWQLLLRIGNKGYIFNRTKGFFIRRFE